MPKNWHFNIKGLLKRRKYLPILKDNMPALSLGICVRSDKKQQQWNKIKWSFFWFELQRKRFVSWTLLEHPYLTETECKTHRLICTSATGQLRRRRMETQGAWINAKYSRKSINQSLFSPAHLTKFSNFLGVLALDHLLED